MAVSLLTCLQAFIWIATLTAIEVMHSITCTHTHGYIMLQYMPDPQLIANFKDKLHYWKKNGLKSHIMEMHT